MKTLFCSDLHLGHRNIYKYRPVFESTAHNDMYFLELLRHHASKRSTIYFLGDTIFDKKYLPQIKSLPGRKIKILGNHCTEYLKISDLVDTFDDVLAYHNYKGFTLSHMPIHEAELRGKKNVHGHVHHYTVQDSNYLNVSVDSEFMKYNLRSLEEVREALNNPLRSLKSMSTEESLESIYSEPVLKRIYEETKQKSREINFANV